MRPSPKIGNSHLEQMNVMYRFICDFNVDKLLYTIDMKHPDEEWVEEMTLEVKDQHLKLQRKRPYLLNLRKTWNKEFTHEDNGEAALLKKALWHMRSGTKGLKSVFWQCRKRSNKKLPPGTPQPQAHEVSLINQKNYYKDLYGLENFPSCVQELLMAMMEFYATLHECLDLAQITLDEEKATKADSKQTLKVLRDSVKKSREGCMFFIMRVINNPAMRKAYLEDKELMGDERNPVLKAYKQCGGNVEAFSQKYFHNDECKPSDVGKITIYEFLAEPAEAEDPDIKMARVVFGEDDAWISRINHVIENFDRLLPEKCPRGKVPSMQLYFFMEWSRSKKGIETFLIYFNKRYTEHGGKWKVPEGNSGIVTARKCFNQGDGRKSELERRVQMERLQKERLAFVSKLEKLVGEKFPKLEVAS